MSRCDCGNVNAEREYIDETTYFCRGIHAVAFDFSVGQPVPGRCNTRMTDHAAVERIEAARRKKKEREDLMVAAATHDGTKRYCVCGTIAVGRCARCSRDFCPDEERCRSWDSERRAWICRECVSALAREQAQAEEREKVRERAAYEALPVPTVVELVRFLDGAHTVIVDGRTQRTDRVTHADVAAAYAELFGADAGGVSWSSDHPRDTVSLHPDGTLTGSNGRPLSTPTDRFLLSRVPRRADVTALAVVRARQEQEDAYEAAQVGERETRERRERHVASLQLIVRPVLVLLPALLPLGAGVLSYRSDVVRGRVETFALAWPVPAGPAMLIVFPLTLFAVLGGGLVLASRLRARAWTSAVGVAVLLWLPPVWIGLLLGETLIPLSPTLQAIAASAPADVLVALFG